MNEWTYIMNTINLTLGVDIMDRSRHRDLIEGRVIFYHIMRYKFKKTASSIGKRVFKSHATVLHGLKNFDDWVRTDSDFKNKYSRVMDSLNLLDEAGDFEISSDAFEIKQKNYLLLNNNQLLTLQLEDKSSEINNLKKELLRFSIYNELFNRIMSKAPPGKEQALINKLNATLNGVQF